MIAQEEAPYELQLAGARTETPNSQKENDQ